ncbi:MAG: hypothetical protein KKH52_01000 [Nanoarchaeota archaeon]|nr:hypothetical protein [Nanoarchaeota archaeon]MBU1622941.1 hypothetical protein [Nanoarchaeota archaeon]MBU1973954.1 hypothetical protein [Nanoarchaeota archaeon]
MVNLIQWFGILAFIFFLATAIFGYLVQKGKTKLSWHKVIATLALLLALVHVGLIYLR